MINRIVLVTGTSSGIGLATAVAIAKGGDHVVATLRNPAGATALRAAAEASGVTLDIRPLDVVHEASVASCIAGIVADHGRIDAVINNAGAGHVGTLEIDSIDDVRQVMEVNFFGVLLVSRAAMPHLRASKGRLITVTSVGGVIGQPFNEAYCAAKFAVEGYMESLAPVAAKLGVSVSVVEPGAVASEFVANAGVDADAMIAAAGPYAPAMAAYAKRTLSQFANAAQPPHEVADAIRALLDAPNPSFRSQTSPMSRSFVAAKLVDLDGSIVSGVTSTWLD